jgi:L-asparaginase/Glu-tRNA(Gln) amidotransferase subunit D
MSSHPVAGDATIGLVLTGGTIGAERRGAALSVGAHATRAEVGLLASAWPGAGEPRVVVAEPLRKLSENAVPSDWLAIASAVRQLMQDDGASGVLVLHGTDTMAYTAAALGFLLADVARPIVLSGASLPAGQLGSDAAANVRAALVALGSLEGGVHVVFGAGEDRRAHVHLGTRVRKQRGGGETFVSVNRELVAMVAGDLLTPVRAYERRPRERSLQALDERALALRLHPGLDFDLAYETVVRGDVRAVVVELYPSATGPAGDDRYSLARFVRRCAERETIVALVAPGSAGPPPPHTHAAYETTLAIVDAGALWLGDMSGEAAIVKAMWALAQSQRGEDVAQLLLEPIAGELATED